MLIIPLPCTTCLPLCLTTVTEATLGRASKESLLTVEQKSTSTSPVVNLNNSLHLVVHKLARLVVDKVPKWPIDSQVAVLRDKADKSKMVTSLTLVPLQAIRMLLACLLSIIKPQHTIHTNSIMASRQRRLSSRVVLEQFRGLGWEG
jgi:hypothetical protein